MRIQFALRSILVMSCTLLLLAGCAGKSAPTRFYMLNASEAGVATPTNQDTLVVALEEVTIPPYLDRPNIVTRTEGTRVHLAEFDYWAEPLRDAVFRYLLVGLAKASDATVVAVSTAERDLTLKVSILRFDVTEGGQANLQVMWLLEPYDTSSSEAGQQWQYAQYTEKAADNSYAAIVDAQSRLLDKLVADVALSIRKRS